MKLAALLLTAGALVALAPASSSAIPVSNLANVATDNVEQVRLVCRHGRCWRTGRHFRRQFVRRYFGPRYYYGSAWGYYPYSYYRPYRYSYWPSYGFWPAYGYNPYAAFYRPYGYYRPAYAYAPGFYRPYYAWAGWGWRRPAFGFGIWF